MSELFINEEWENGISRIKGSLFTKVVSFVVSKVTRSFNSDGEQTELEENMIQCIFHFYEISYPTKTLAETF